MASNWRDTLQQADSRSAAPAGLQQQQAAGSAPAAPPADSQGGWRDILDSQNRSQGRPAWNTGGQLGSTENGWNTPFYQKMFEQQARHEKAGTLNAWYKGSDFTGVATWGGQKDHSGRAIEVGDPSYRTIKGILIAGTEHGTAEPVTDCAAGAVGAFLRGPEQFDTPVA